MRWLNGTSRLFEKKVPAIAFPVPVEIADLDANIREWEEVTVLLDFAKMLT